MGKEMGKVVLIAGGEKVYADIAARFCRSEDDIDTIIDKPYTPKIIENILSSGHFSALEFDYFLFGVEGFSRVCETQLVRKRMASYMIKSGREELNGKRKFDVYLPSDITAFETEVEVPRADFVENSDGILFTKIKVRLNARIICQIIEEWYAEGVKQGKKEENLRYLKPQGTTFKGIIGMNAHALRDFFSQRMCMRAQAEIRDMATQMFTLARKAVPDLFKDAGPKCVQLGYCPENERQHEFCRITRKILTKDKALEVLKQWQSENK